MRRESCREERFAGGLCPAPGGPSVLVGPHINSGITVQNCLKQFALGIDASNNRGRITLKASCEEHHVGKLFQAEQEALQAWAFSHQYLTVDGRFNSLAPAKLYLMDHHGPGGAGGVGDTVWGARLSEGAYQGVVQVQNHRELVGVAGSPSAEMELMLLLMLPQGDSCSASSEAPLG
eukprot:CAMPEP_0117686228 /NCGR_PEP_ID=MMETSP0804-20121206/22308_1 /TAXON_ID=1074897 /ORGANISM="Tetraselmis astigmatica, Strain CCMP880" /LENGTH=176 /DNA_ID=CAMNT_0005497847 /DNA_START=603 /DNA_END=1135 /DNA_ORIENTATION=+